MTDKNVKSPLVYETMGPEDTSALARSLAGHLQPGDWIFLIGEIGTGKTHFVKGLGDALHCEGLITSATFTLIQTYRTKKGPGLLHHVDLYRLSKEDTWDLEWDRLLASPGVTLVEWAEKAQKGLCPEDVLTVALSHAGENRRRLEFSASGPRSQILLKKLKGTHP